MNYHLHSQGQNQGIFPLDELRRRRAAGELTGAELVWCAGMPDWRPLDTVLQPPASSPASPSCAPIPAAPRRRTTPVIVTAGVVFLVLLMVGAVLLGLASKRILRDLRNLGGGSGTSGVGTAASDAPLELAGKPVVVSSNAVTFVQVDRQHRAFRVRQYLEGYKQFGERNPATDAAALQLIEAWIASNFPAPGDSTNLPSLTELSTRLADDPNCTDPVVLSVTALNTDSQQETVRRFERAVQGFELSRHRAYPRFFAAATLAGRLLKDESSRRPVLEASAVQAFREGFKDGSFLPEDQPELADILVSGWGEGCFSRNASALAEIPLESNRAFEWLTLTLRGESERKAAWKARGGGYADTVSERGWREFGEHLETARKHLTRAWELHPEWPIAPDRMIYVTLGSGGLAEMRTWFDRTVAAQFDYPSAWQEMRWGLLPRYYGDLRAMRAFGLVALNTRRFDTDVPRKFFDVVADLESELKLPRGQHIYARPDLWPHLQEMYEGYLAEPAQAASRYGWRSSYAVVAYLAGQYTVARDQLATVDWNPKRWNLSGWGTDLSLMSLEVAARTGPAGKLVAQAETARVKNDLMEATRSFTKLSELADADPRTRAFVRDRLATLDQEQRMQAGEWVDLLPEDDAFTGWCVVRGKCLRSSEGALEAQSGPDGHLLYSRVRLGREFEVRGEIETVRSSTAAFDGDVVIGLPEIESTGWYAFRIKRTAEEGDQVAFSRHWGRSEFHKPLALDARTNSFLLRFNPDRVSASVNGQPVFQEVKVPKNNQFPTNEIYLGLGAFNGSNETVMRYRKLQVHQITGR